MSFPLDDFEVGRANIRKIDTITSSGSNLRITGCLPPRERALARDAPIDLRDTLNRGVHGIRRTPVSYIVACASVKAEYSTGTSRDKRIQANSTRYSIKRVRARARASQTELYLRHVG